MESTFNVTSFQLHYSYIKQNTHLTVRFKTTLYFYFRLNCTFCPLSFEMLRFWPPIKKNGNFGPFRQKIAEKMPRVPKKGHNRNFL